MYVCPWLCRVIVCGLSCAILNMVLQAIDPPDDRLLSGEVWVNDSQVIVPLSIADERRVHIQNLLSALARQPKTERLIQICYALGELRAEQAIDELIPHLLVQVEVTLGKQRPRWGEYPIREALIKIGHPAAQRLLDRLGADSSEEFQRSAVFVIRAVYSAELAKQILEQKAAAETDHDRQARILACVPLLESLHYEMI